MLGDLTNSLDIPGRLSLYWSIKVPGETREKLRFLQFAYQRDMTEKSMMKNVCLRAQSAATTNSHLRTYANWNLQTKKKINKFPESQDIFICYSWNFISSGKGGVVYRISITILRTEIGEKESENFTEAPFVVIAMVDVSRLNAVVSLYRVIFVFRPACPVVCTLMMKVHYETENSRLYSKSITLYRLLINPVRVIIAESGTPSSSWSSRRKRKRCDFCKIIKKKLLRSIENR